jgi:predicted nucleic acid-binding protein
MGLSIGAVYDSVILIDALKDIRDAGKRLLADGNRTISVVTRTEVLAGVRTEGEQIVADAMLDSCTNIDVNKDIANLAAALRRQFRLKTPDAIIYATARILRVPLVTRDTGFPNEADVVRI